MEDIISKTQATNEFFINKAISCALREYGKDYPNKVIELASKYPLSKFSKREALKQIAL
ncbi:DNA alkylation repair protein [Neobacillus sp. YX16]|uniref:DNA alkylation repair protein n=1 Tax=Neobacillus sp. YX16 TaxID=3047874 RepID=UPI0024C265A6|nr:DNA alkylation repair protein [Neobacillus sp. YX16]WHZ05917.1 DNA alkylation repair protein [Neobacillus sp. YX16]